MKEQISGWIDGELAPQEAERLVASVPRDAAQRACCSTYWLIGDALREEAQPCLGEDFTARVMVGLEQEPTVLAPVAAKPRFRHPPWYAMAAAVSGVVMAVWMGLSLWPAASVDAGMATVAVQPVTAPGVAEIVPVSDQDIDDRAYLMAHRASVMGSPVGVAASIRTVSDERMGTR
ncbi:MAG: anti-sigma 24 factor [Candidatus Dactylopiibacterium carminicum]|uniref:Anti-sigma 24 factor n=1 Tax=Candidatus Dactylopiibacterium carminicum TaxID=857335 RepID=A0A272EST9_9RHOO|nr:RseA family anti-sigma factor [Candidatus Dactylopiibacterium carminicum]KAF7599091.1 anti-sigma 24 factor [Candidatus Dactylopiibacterium carminicum]PAS93148.1 MAG: anti-sigma 24 factor [Candidatus Dactylopiibacterium carminicum]PAS96880.1 MAG: anti-sigma 24 factor [Candidatus Dactylopiibacterium carminicum]PAS99105.1 MAG: hypothetical protein BSR46_09725 [Candidatus Dactylopiibacterium carminicum]